ncbi:hypothetical protein PM082_003091 [Marasmius tenuissimus]|nr:hypothetical protein PM082_003091 [Marasmius tenuissimus]
MFVRSPFQDFPTTSILFPLTYRLTLAGVLPSSAYPYVHASSSHAYGAPHGLNQTIVLLSFHELRNGTCGSLYLVSGCSMISACDCVLAGPHCCEDIALLYMTTTVSVVSGHTRVGIGINETLFLFPLFLFVPLYL